ncbi:MAG: arsenate reductase ArsC [Bacteroidia bacterium]|nr:arsenate reductase ArsC [Bacteroidia bacterium]
MSKTRVLFVCIHNSARSQMAEAFLNNLAGDRFEAESAGLEPGILNPFVVKAMREAGIDISGHKTKDVFEFFKQGKRFDYVITVCDEGSAGKCPFFPSQKKKINWSFPDPSKFEGSEAERMLSIRNVRDAVKQKVETFVKELAQVTP